MCIEKNSSFRFKISLKIWLQKFVKKSDITLSANSVVESLYMRIFFQGVSFISIYPVDAS